MIINNGLMISVNNTLETADGCFSECAEINMNAHENSQ
jgi:hypothetical protein